MLVVDNLKKSFGNREVVQNISFTVQKGESFGLLGPNGAGKSTTISMISGLLSIDSGRVVVGGVSVQKQPMESKKKIGVVPQEIALYPTISAKENLVFWGKMYGLTGRQAKKKADEVLETIGLTDRGKDKIETFSGGMKRRVNIGAALMHEPELLIMDEPTVGIDPQSRNHILETVKMLNQNGMTVIYTSHYMEEVDFLCERIGIIDNGQLIALGTKKELCNRLAGGTIQRIQVSEKKESFVKRIKALDSVEDIVTTDSHIEIVGSDQSLADLITIANQEKVKILNIQIQEPNLESLFLQLTGRTLRD
ncbi:ABC transporter ATP-binding protein [Ferdinandcohnia quinoae]|uniref:ABC transporter ATP-binding protein n=1 Tax=Fredinandcohnia quinoae TaxID=2918902 RepID=A0AAW5E8A3_9BACI|nr:ABC transporter ATP-binding protein [Fredinandcohnia sp. SECRCQ15]MCH1625601.1 ABC transporter ATP-binding protein [Fredinandcohnia sp. SECRCQ15]